jgi:hypothetical protein
MSGEGPAYCPYYCEENLWQLAADPRVGPGLRRVLLVSNLESRVALWNQRAGAPDADGLVVWDYHVILTNTHAGATVVWDLDTTLGAPVPWSRYLASTFRGAPEPFSPMFRVLDAEVYRRVFSSDRRHMRDDAGAYQQPPPTWPPIGSGHTLPGLLDFTHKEPGEVVDLPGLVALPGLQLSRPNTGR